MMGSVRGVDEEKCAQRGAGLAVGDTSGKGRIQDDAFVWGIACVK